MDIQTERPPESIKYALTSRDFEKPPMRIVSYKVGDTIDRENFTSFLIHSFAISRGAQDAQIVFFRWLEVNQGFDYYTSVRKFLSSGGFENLGSDEKKLIIEAFHRVKKHSNDEEFMKRDFAKEFNENIRFSPVTLDRIEESIPDGELKEITYSELLKKIEPVIAVRKTERKSAV